jgi:FkbM family methyltransferase
MSYIKNYFLIILASLSKKASRGKYFRKKIFSTKRILNENFPENYPFSFLQVGANDGVSFDFLYYFVKKRDSKGLVVEPIKSYFEELCKNYIDNPKIVKVNKAVHKELKEALIFKIDNSKICNYPDWVKGIASFQKSHINKFDLIIEDDIVEEIVKADTLENIINEGKITEFDYFQIDTEGYDYKVIEMFDFMKHKPKVIRAEYINLSKQEKSLIYKTLSKKGYHVFLEGMDIVAVDLKRINL